MKKHTYKTDFEECSLTILREYEDGYVIRIESVHHSGTVIFPFIAICKESLNRFIDNSNDTITTTDEEIDYHEPPEWNHTFFENRLGDCIARAQILYKMMGGEWYSVKDKIHTFGPIYPIYAPKREE